jgi:uncharacterized membrane protein
MGTKVSICHAGEPRELTYLTYIFVRVSESFCLYCQYRGTIEITDLEILLLFILNIFP